MDEALRARARNLPRDPGVYLWKDAQGRILYVGKAQDLRARVTSYLGTPADERLAQLQANAAGLDFVAVGSIKEALILEQNLIKHHRPPYNVLLVDDKTYPYIAVTNEAYPRVVYTRDLEDRAALFGPFPDAGKAKRIAQMLNRTFQLRQCRVLPARECLYFHLHQCSAPCIGAVTKDAYGEQAVQAARFLEGEGATLSRQLRRDMEEDAKAERFERAAQLRDLVAAIDSVLERQRAASIAGRDYDAIGFAQRDDRACALVLVVRDGGVVGHEPHFLGGVSGEPLSRIVSAFVSRYYAHATSLPPEILVPVRVDDDAVERALSDRRGSRVRVRAPERGDARGFLELAEKNARLSLDQEFLSRERRGSGAVEALQRALGLTEPPETVEAFDVSHSKGQHTVASMVVLRDGKPFKAGYRRFRIRGPGGGDDPLAMREVVRRRYERVLREEGADAMPDLVVVDGGPAQVAAAHEELVGLGLGATPLVGLAKRLEELYRPNVLHPLRLDSHSSALQLLQLVRDEAHRFAIGYQRTLRRKAFVGSRLDEIPGVGPERRRRLLATFGSVDGVKAATEEELLKVPGITRPVAKRIRDSLAA
ncbi:MAG: excinuclease ABC subunit UvrC [Euryarchaeota archaeon]|nr:excinuclease ABC subunit UvrC [Euryarchaeota archaeon]